MTWAIWIVFSSVQMQWANRFHAEMYDLVSDACVVMTVITMYHSYVYQWFVVRLAFESIFLIAAMLFGTQSSLLMNSSVFVVVIKTALFCTLFLIGSTENELMYRQWMVAAQTGQNRLSSNGIGVGTGLSTATTSSSSSSPSSVGMRKKGDTVTQDTSINVDALFYLNSEQFFYGSWERLIFTSGWILFVNPYFILIGLVQIGFLSYKIGVMRTLMSKKISERNSYDKLTQGLLDGRHEHQPKGVGTTSHFEYKDHRGGGKEEEEEVEVIVSPDAYSAYSNSKQVHTPRSSSSKFEEPFELVINADYGEERDVDIEINV